MRLAITGASGLVGYPVARYFQAKGHEIVTLGRHEIAGFAHQSWQLGQQMDLSGIDHLIHAGFSHIPGRYRGGEGDDPDGFIEKNQEGSLMLWQAARRAGTHVVFVSSRAAYGDYPPGTLLQEHMQAPPTTLYGQVKRAAEDALSTQGVSLRATGVYGPKIPWRDHKWASLFDQYLAGQKVPARIGTELHVEDLAQAIEIVMALKVVDQVLNVSDITLDRHDLLALVTKLTGRTGQLPAKGSVDQVNAMNTDRLRSLGWQPRGLAGVRETLHDLLDRPASPDTRVSSI